MRVLFDKYLGADGWWKSDTGSFSVQDFLGMLILFESKNSDAETWLQQANKIGTVIAQNLFVGGWKRSTGASFNAILNFMGSWVDSKSSLLQGPESEAVINEFLYSPGLSRESAKNPYELIHSIGEHASNYKSVTTGDRKNGPSIYGNVKGAKDIATSIGTEYGSSENSAYYINGSFVVLSVNQYNHWLSLKMDMSLTYEP